MATAIMRNMDEALALVGKSKRRCWARIHNNQCQYKALDESLY